jgi:hypothetical protein
LRSGARIGAGADPLGLPYLLVTIGDQDDRRRFTDGFTGVHVNSDARRLRRSCCGLGRLFGGRGGGGNNRVLGAGLTIPVASSGRIGSKSSEGRDNKKLLHGQAPLDIGLILPRPGLPERCTVITKP